MTRPIMTHSPGPLIVYRYAVRVTIYDNNLNVRSREQELFRLRRLAEAYARKTRRELDANKLVSQVELIRLSEGSVVENFKTKGFVRRVRR